MHAVPYVTLCVHIFFYLCVDIPGLQYWTGADTVLDVFILESYKYVWESFSVGEGGVWGGVYILIHSTVPYRPCSTIQVRGVHMHSKKNSIK
jgi:hypothetical protein